MAKNFKSYALATAFLSVSLLYSNNENLNDIISNLNPEDVEVIITSDKKWVYIPAKIKEILAAIKIKLTGNSVSDLDTLKALHKDLFSSEDITKDLSEESIKDLKDYFDNLDSNVVDSEKISRHILRELIELTEESNQSEVNEAKITNDTGAKEETDIISEIKRVFAAELNDNPNETDINVIDNKTDSKEEALDKVESTVTLNETEEKEEVINQTGSNEFSEILTKIKRALAEETDLEKEAKEVDSKVETEKIDEASLTGTINISSETDIEA